MVFESLFLLIAGTLFAWRLSKVRPEPDWADLNLWGFTGAMPYRDHAAIKPPGTYIWNRLIVALVGRSIERVKFTNLFLINLGALVALYAWGLPAGLTYLILMNAIHFSSFAGSAEAPATLFLVISLASPNPWVKVIAFSIACFFQHKLFPMGIILYPYVGQTLIVLSLWMVGFAGFWKWKPEIARAVLKSMTVESNRMRKGRIPLLQWFKQQYLGNDNHYQGVGIAILWGGLAVHNRPDILFWLPCILYSAFCLTGKVWRPYNWLPLVPWIAMAIPNALPLLLLISVAQLAWDCFYARDIYLLAYSGLFNEVRWAEQIGNMMKGKKIWVNGWCHDIYIRAECFPRYGIELPDTVGDTFKEWKVERNKRLLEDPPDYVIVGMGQDKSVRIKSSRKQKIGTWSIYQMR